MTRATSLLLAAAVLACAQSVDDGIRAFHQGHYHDAERMLAQFQADARAVAFRAMAQAALGECGQAEAELRKQAGANPEMEVRRLSGLALTQCLIARKDYNGAVPVLAELQKQFPKDADVLYEAARVHMRAWNEAVYEMFRNTPASFRVNQLSAEVFETQGRFTEAAAEYRKAIQKNPSALNLHYRLGRAMLMESHDSAALQQAQKEFEAELAMNPGDAAAEYQLGQILIARQRSTDATARFEKAVSLSPDFVEALVALAKLRIEAKQYAEAVPLLQRAVRLQPEMESAHYSLMIAYRNLGKTEDALREKAALDKLQKLPEGEFSDFLKKLGEKPAKP
jgi:tetratricopeptide (TPR) repeat protein